MTAPTITSITPDRGHAMGRVFVIISGTDFQTPDDPDPSISPVPEPTQRVAVTFGGVPAMAAEVVEADGSEIWAIAPELDPTVDRLVFTVDLDTSTTVLTVAGGHTLVNGMLVFLTTKARPKDFPAPLDGATGYYVGDADQGAGTLTLSLTDGGAAIELTAAGSGELVLNAPKRVEVVVQNLDSDGEAIPDESASFMGYAPVRPNLADEGHLATVVGELIKRLRRGIVANVSWMTSTDYDDETGDTIVAVPLGELPAIFLTDLRTPTDLEYAAGSQGEEEINPDDEEDPGNVIVVKPPEIVRVTVTIIAVSDDPIETLNMNQAVIKLFRDFPTLTVPRDIANLSLGTIEYDIDFSREVAGSVSVVGNDNTTFSAYEVSIRGVRLEDIPGLPRTTVPSAPATMRHQSIQTLGKTAANVPTVTITKKSSS